MPLFKESTIGPALDALYADDIEALGELFSAASDPSYIYCDEATPQRLQKAGFLDERLNPPQVVQKAVVLKFNWVD